jgi:diguanylate cyclase (GGDEF)-like protein
MAVKNRHHMPADDERVEPETVVFTLHTRLRHAQSLLVLPLVRGDQVLGTITLASARERRFPRPTREMLRVISHQVSVSLQNARMYRAMEERATTDGLTGLTNHRAFRERLAQIHALAERTGQKFALILTDIDHFKKVNDTYGHPVGDAVLKRVAAVFAGRARKVDVVARYGGEEFVFILPDTDGEGAELFANKLREEVAAQIMTSEQGPFQVTISMGVAEYPQDCRDPGELIERADQALYRCKHGGRNCVVRWSRTPAAPIPPPYREHLPHPQLRGLVACYWSHRSTGRARVLPDACIDLLFRRPLAAPADAPWHAELIGTMTRAILSAPLHEEYLGVRFHPGEAPRILGLAAHEITDAKLPLADLWTHRDPLTRNLARARTLRDLLSTLDTALLARPLAAPDHRVRRVLATLRTTEARIDELARRESLGERQLLRLFDHHVGASPKTIARVFRLERALALTTPTPRWSDIAAATGYADQPHLIREFQSLTGLTPTQLLHERATSDPFNPDPAPAPTLPNP